MSTGIDEQLGGKYRVLAHLGQGGTANVFLAVARGPSGFNKLVVLKSMKPALKAEPDVAGMFLSEARLAARLNHPNIVQTNEVFESPDGPVIVMEYLEGQPLSQVLHRMRGKEVFPLSMHLRVICEALAGLHHAHELTDFDGRALNVVHRDMSPHNVFVTFEGQVKILDFGIAKLEGSHAETATGVIKGKVRYMSPEQITGEGVDRRSDVYAVGIMLWEAIAGERMWHGVGEATVMNRVLNDEIVPIRQVKPDVPEALERIVHKALRGDPSQRQASALELLKELEDYLVGAGAPPLRPRELGAVVAGLFETERGNMRHVIEQQLAKVASLSAAEYEVIELTGFGSSTGLSTSQEKPRPRRVALYTAAAVVLLFAGAFVLMRAPAAELPVSLSQGPAAPPPPPSLATAGSPATPAPVRLRVTAFPAEARLVLDGEPQPANPLSREFSRDAARTVTIEAMARGHVADRRVVSLGEDAEVVFNLKPEPAAAPPGRPRGHASTATRAAGPTSSPAAGPQTAPACDPPFVIDARGVKRFKPECL